MSHDRKRVNELKQIFEAMIRAFDNIGAFSDNDFSTALTAATVNTRAWIHPDEPDEEIEQDEMDQIMEWFSSILTGCALCSLVLKGAYAPMIIDGNMCFHSVPKPEKWTTNWPFSEN